MRRYPYHCGACRRDYWYTMFDMAVHCRVCVHGIARPVMWTVNGR